MKYAFRAVYDDGTIIEQNPETSEEKTFKDIDTSKVVEFSLHGDNKVFKVNPRTGEFTLDGLPVRFDWLKGKYELVYFRRVRIDAMPDMMLTTTMFAIGLKTVNEGETSEAIVLVDEYGKVKILNKK